MGGRAALTKNRADETDRLELRPQWADEGEGIDGSALTFLVDRANAFSMTSAFSSIMDGIAATATDNISLPLEHECHSPNPSQFIMNTKTPKKTDTTET